ncbi:MAG: hypothetical protein ACW98F_20310 [Candidatus Hodarchaeales archaeon]|jgi:uncharacterized membrane protein YbhN (UPF0104 family)
MDLSAREIILEKEIIWKIKKEIDSDLKLKSFYEYLKKEKELFDRPRPIKQMIIVGIGIVFLLIFLFYQILTFIDFSFDFLNNKPIGPLGLQSEEFSLLLIATTLATILGVTLSITFIIFKYLLTKAHWSRFHDQTLALIGRLDEESILENYISFEKDTDISQFKLNKISIDFQIQWLFPLIFDALPPLLLEISILSFLLPFSISVIVSFFVLLATFDWFSFLLSCVLMVAVIFGYITSINSMIHSWRKYNWLRNLMIDRQQEIIHKLILQQADNLEILVNEQNLTRLEKMHSFPLPAIVRVSATIPVLGSFVGYLIGLLIIK